MSRAEADRIEAFPLIGVAGSLQSAIVAVLRGSTALMKDCDEAGGGWNGDMNTQIGADDIEVATAQAFNCRTVCAGAKDCMTTCSDCPDLTAHFREADFKPENHRIEHREERVALIDGRPFFGTDWSSPIREVSDAWVQVPEGKIALDVTGMFNLMEGEHTFQCTHGEGSYYLTGYFSDGAGTYRARWLIVGSGSMRVLLQRTGM